MIHVYDNFALSLSSDPFSVLIVVLIATECWLDERVDTLYYEDHNMLIPHKVLSAEEDQD